MSTRKYTILFCTLLASVNIQATWVSAFSFVPLGDLPDGVFSSTPTGISGNGKIVVGYSTSASGTEAFRWTAGTGMVGLGDLGGGSFASRANAISDDGSTIVGFGSTSNGSEAFRWTEQEGIISLYDPNGIDRFVEANDVSADGSVIVGNGSVFSPIRWTGVTGATVLPMEFCGGCDAPAALAISGDGSLIAGQVSFFPTAVDAVIWRDDATGAFLFGPGDNTSQGDLTFAYAISADASIVVGSTVNSATGNYAEAFRWTQAEGPVFLGVPSELPSGLIPTSSAFDISPDGTVIVGQGSDCLSCGPADARLEAIVWDEQNGWQIIEQILTNSGIDLSGWQLTSANAVNANGTIVVGAGINPNGNPEAWLAVIAVPEPHAIGLLQPIALSGLLLCRWRARR